MKRAMVKKDYKEIDETIKAKVAPFLYNNGDGAMVPIAQITYYEPWSARINLQSPKSDILQIKSGKKNDYNFNKLA